MSFSFEVPIGRNARFLLKRNGEPWAGFDTLKSAEDAVEMYRTPRKIGGKLDGKAAAAKGKLTPCELSRWEIGDTVNNVTIKSWPVKS